MPTTDFLIIGSGIAGLSYAYKVALSCPDKQVTIVTKSDDSESNTQYAQGGIAITLTEDDSFEKHIQDTIKAGDGLCDPDVVRLVVEEGPQRLQELLWLGVHFDHDAAGGFNLGKEGGHSEKRIVHYKDVTGSEIEKALLNQVYDLDNVEVLSHHFAIDLITQHQLGAVEDSSQLTCYGAYVLNEHTGEIKTHTSSITLLASGGAGQAYAHTTNPAVATGDGIAMAYRARAGISNMEFVQFHPTALYYPGESPVFLISEALRGFGGLLKLKNGQSFMQLYDPRAELASRDIVSRAIDSELKRTGDEHVYLDCRHLNRGDLKLHFPNIYSKCESIGIFLESDMIPVAPAAHYFCGGVDVDENGKTSINHLYACGECTCTGLHGANRLASNSLLEALVYSERCYISSVKESDSITMPTVIPEWNDEGTVTPQEAILISHNKKEVQSIMQDYVGIVRSNERLQRAISRLDLLYRETEALYKSSKLSPQLCELRNLITVGYLIVRESLKRKENRGAYWNVDL